MHPYIFLPAPPIIFAKTKLSLLFFKNSKMYLNCIFFFLFGLWNPENFGLSLPVKFRIYQSIIQNMHFTLKNSSLKKTFRIHQFVTEICIMDSEIHNSKKSILDSPIHNRIRLSDSAIRKSRTYAKFASETPPDPEKKNDSVPD